MQWVPSGDGVYRLTDGNGFLKTKQGDFYEIDVVKLNFDASWPRTAIRGTDGRPRSVQGQGRGFGRSLPRTARSTRRASSPTSGQGSGRP
jgi:hypothetical protein